MTTNLKIQIDDKADIDLARVPGSSTQSILTIQLDADPLETWNNGAATGVNGNTGVDFMGLPIDFSFPVNNNLANNIIRTEINRVEITGPTNILTTFRNLILLKNDIKNIGANPQNIFDFELTTDKDISKQDNHWKITAESTPGANDRTLKLSEADFGGTLDESKISIDDTQYHNDPDNQIRVVENRNSQKQALLDLEKLLKYHLPTRYKIKYSVDDAFNGLDFERGPDANFIDGSADLGDGPSPTNPVPRNGLWAYITGSLKGSNYITAEVENIKHILYDLNDANYDKIYCDEIEGWTFYLLVSTNYLQFFNVTKKSEYKILNSPDGSGFDNYWDLPELLKEKSLYKGFPIIDPNFQALPDSADGNKFKVSKKEPNKLVRYTKESIDNFREFATGYTDADGNAMDIFTKEKTIKDKDNNDVQVYVNHRPEECLGFQPGDVYLTTGGVIRYRNSLKAFSGVSKMVEDIWVAQNAEEALDLAFYGKDYDEPLSFKAIRKGNSTLSTQQKLPNVNLQFNEITGRNRLDTLNYYYQALQNSAKCQWVIPGDATGAGAKSAPKYDDPATKAKIDTGYQLAKEFITDYEEIISGVNITSLDKTQLEATKAKLEKWKTTRFYTSNGAWKPVIDNFLAEVNGALSLLNDDPDDDVPTWQTELAGLKNRASDLGKKIYQNCEPDQNGFTEAVFEELKKLVKLLEEAHGTKTTNTKTELEQFISDNNNDTNKKKALEIAQKVKNQDSDSKNCVETALKKLKSPQEKQLKKTRQELKSLLAGLKIDGKCLSRNKSRHEGLRNWD